MRCLGVPWIPLVATSVLPGSYPCLLWSYPASSSDTPCCWKMTSRGCPPRQMSLGVLSLCLSLLFPLALCALWAKSMAAFCPYSHTHASQMLLCTPFCLLQRPQPGFSVPFLWLYTSSPGPLVQTQVSVSALLVFCVSGPQPLCLSFWASAWLSGHLTPDWAAFALSALSPLAFTLDWVASYRHLSGASRFPL